MIPYKIALVTPTARTEIAPPSMNYQRVKEQFYKLCSAYDRLPTDVLCILEQNSLVIETYRINSLCDTYIVDGIPLLASKAMAHRKSLAGMPHRPEIDPNHYWRRLDMGNIATAIERRELKYGSEKGTEEQKPPTCLAKRVYRSVALALLFKTNASSKAAKEFQFL